MATEPSGGFDLQGALSQLRANQSTTSSASAPVVPLWKIKPTPMAKAPRQRGGMDSAEWEAVQALPKQAIDVTKVDGVSSDAAEATWMDMSDADRLDFLKSARAAGLVSGDGKVSPAELAGAWAKAVSAAKGYNLAQKDKSKWISPWDAVKKLGLADAAANGGAFDAYGASKAGTRRQSSSNVRKFSANDLALAANSILRQTLGQDATPQQLAAYTEAVNAASAASPEVTDQFVTQDEAGNTTTQASTSGGIDANAVILDRAKRDPAYARTQAAMTFFPAAMNALNAVV